MADDTNHRIERDMLTKEAYATDEHLAVRYRTHELYSQPQIDFPKWVVDTLLWRGDEWVLDVGSGPGLYFDLVRQRAPDGRLIAGDLSFGMARQARTDTSHGASIWTRRNYPLPTILLTWCWQITCFTTLWTWITLWRKSGGCCAPMAA